MPVLHGRSMLLRSLVLTAAAMLVPTIAHAVTPRDIVELSKAGVSEAILIALIDSDQTVFALDANEILTLHEAGVSDVVLLKMLRAATPGLTIVGNSRPSRRIPTIVVPYYVLVPMPIFREEKPARPPVRRDSIPPQPSIAFGRFINDGTTGR